MAKILLVEDDNNLREIYEARLQAEGYSLVSAKDGEEALVMAKNEMPDLIISDVMMPKVSGFEMLDILRNTDGLKEVKVIMLTALGQSDDQQRADSLGADRYLVKSQVTLEDIVKVTHELLHDSTDATPETAVNEPSPAAPTASAPEAPATPTVNPSLSGSVVTEDSPFTTPPPVPLSNETPAPVVPTDVEQPFATDDIIAQSKAQEEADVNAEIEDFVATATTDTPAAPTDNSRSEQDIDATDSKVMSEAIDNLMANTPQAAVVPTTISPQVTPINISQSSSDTAPADTVNLPSANGSVSIAHKKVISPLDSLPKQDIHSLWALEEAKTAQAAPTTSVAEVVAQTQPLVMPQPPPDTSTSLISPIVIGPDTGSTAFNPVDPNHIAL